MTAVVGRVGFAVAAVSAVVGRAGFAVVVVSAAVGRVGLVGAVSELEPPCGTVAESNVVVGFWVWVMGPVWALLFLVSAPLGELVPASRRGMAWPFVGDSGGELPEWRARVS